MVVDEARELQPATGTAGTIFPNKSLRGYHKWCWVADYPDPDNYLRVGLGTLSTGWRHPAYEGLVERARRLADQRQRMGLYGQADRILVEEAAFVPLFYGRNALLIKPWVRKFPMSARGGWFWKDIIIEPHG